MLYERRLFYKIFFLQVSLFSPVLAQESPVFSLVAQALLPDFDFPCIFDLRFLCFSSPFFHVCFESIVHSHHSAQTQIQKKQSLSGEVSTTRSPMQRYQSTCNNASNIEFINYPGRFQIRFSHSIGGEPIEEPDDGKTPAERRPMAADIAHGRRSSSVYQLAMSAMFCPLPALLLYNPFQSSSF